MTKEYSNHHDTQITLECNKITLKCNLGNKDSPHWDRGSNNNDNNNNKIISLDSALALRFFFVMRKKKKKRGQSIGYMEDTY